MQLKQKLGHKTEEMPLFLCTSNGRFVLPLVGAVQFCNYMPVTRHTHFAGQTMPWSNQWVHLALVFALLSVQVCQVSPTWASLSLLRQELFPHVSFLQQQYLEHHCLIPEVAAPKKKKKNPTMPTLATINQLHCHFQAQSFTSSIYKSLFFKKRGGALFSLRREVTQMQVILMQANERHSWRLKLQLPSSEPRECGQKRVQPWAELPQAIVNQGTPEREKNTDPSSLHKAHLVLSR